MMKPYIVWYALAAVLAGCGGGGEHSGVPATPAQAASGARAPLSLRIDVPTTTGSSGRRVPKFVSPATTQAVINITSGGTSIAGYPQTVGLTPTSGGCSSTLASTQCVIALSLQPGSYMLSLALEDASNSVLSQAQSVPISIVAGQTNVVSLTVGGLAASVQIEPLNTHRMQVAGTSASLYGNVPMQFEALALDADGNVIVGPGAPVPSVALTSGAHATLTPPSASSPNVWTITPHYTATDPTIPTTDTLTFSATPVPASGGTTATSSSALSIYQPWIYVLDTTGEKVAAFDETGAAVALSGGAFTGGAMTHNEAAMTFAQGAIYVVSGASHNHGEISSYAPSGGSPILDVTDASTNFGLLDAPLNPNSATYDSNLQRLYVGDSSSDAALFAVDTTLSTANGVVAVVSNTGLGPHGFAFDPATHQLVAPSQTGGLIVCSEALSCTGGIGSSVNASGIDYDAATGLFGVGLASGGIAFEDVTGTVSGSTGTATGLAPNALAYDPFADAWYWWTVGSGMTEYTTGGTAVGSVFGLTATDTVAAIAIVP